MCRGFPPPTCKQPSCTELTRLRAKTEVQREYLDFDERGIRDLRRRIRERDPSNRKLLDELGAYIDALLGGTPLKFVEIRRELAVAERVTDLALKLVTESREGLLRFRRRLDAVIAERCKPPPGGANRPPVISAFTARFGPPDTCDTCTIYKVQATDPEGQPLTYSWSKSPPPGSANPGATNCGTFTPGSAANQAVWDHPNEGPNACSHAAGEHSGHITVVVTDAQGAQTLFTDPNGSANYNYP